MHHDPSPPQACSLTTAEFRERRARIRETLARQIAGAERIPNGWKLRFERRQELITQLAQLVGLEAACCSFLGLRLDIEPAGGSVWLHVTGIQELPSWMDAARSTTTNTDRQPPVSPHCDRITTL